MIAPTTDNDFLSRDKFKQADKQSKRAEITETVERLSISLQLKQILLPTKDVWEEETWRNVSLMTLVAEVKGMENEERQKVLKILFEKYIRTGCDNERFTFNCNSYILSAPFTRQFTADDVSVLRAYLKTNTKKEINYSEQEVSKAFALIQWFQQQEEYKNKPAMVWKNALKEFVNNAKNISKEYKGLIKDILLAMKGTDEYLESLLAGLRDQNVLLAELNRKIVDPNKGLNQRRIAGRRTRVEAGHGIALAHHFLLEQWFDKQGWLKENGQLNHQVTQIIFLERDSTKPLTIAFAPYYDNHLPCDEELIQSFTKKLRDKMTKAGILEDIRWDPKDGQGKILLQKEKGLGKFGGQRVNVDRRYGLDDFERLGWGKSFNVIQLAVPKKILRYHGQDFLNIIKEILKELASNSWL